MKVSIIPSRTPAALMGALFLGLALNFGASAQEPGATYDEAELLETGALNDNTQGEDDAPVTIIEYASMTCPHCASFHKNAYPKIKQTYVDTGKARMIFREFPLDRLALAIAMLARCVEPDRFFPFIDILFTQQKTWRNENPIKPLKKFAKQAGLNDEAFDKCLSNQELLDGIWWIKNRGGEEFNVNGTPSFFVNGEFVSAQQAQDFDVFSEIVEKHLSE